MPRVFLVTGCSTGFGHDLVQKIIDKGDPCVATARKPDHLKFTGTNEKVTDQKNETMEG
jgi:NADP-dependent 3-hydroxy acid dehydrogenase YdfG